MRKTYNNYQEDYNEILEKKEFIESRIKKRAEDLCFKQPDVIVAYRADDNRTPIKALDFFNEINHDEKDFFYYCMRSEFIIRKYLYLIQKIEEYNRRNENVKQLKMF